MTGSDGTGNSSSLKKDSESGSKSQSTNNELITWVYINGLGERDLRNATESDTLTAICFDKLGEHLAVGDKGGRVIIFKH